MTLGEKIRDARKQNGLTQEELAGKLMVSRQAITKWESDKGMPDIDNLKRLSLLLGVTVDYLISDGDITEKTVIREAIDLSGKSGKAKRKNAVVKEKYPDSVIHNLLMKQKSSKPEKIIGNLVGLLTDAPFGLPEFINSVKNMENEFYLVDKGDRQFLVIVSDEFIESHEMVQKKINRKGEKFEVGQYAFTNLGEIKATPHN